MAQVLPPSSAGHPARRRRYEKGQRTCAAFYLYTLCNGASPYIKNRPEPKSIETCATSSPPPIRTAAQAFSPHFVLFTMLQHHSTSILPTICPSHHTHQSPPRTFPGQELSSDGPRLLGRARTGDNSGPDQTTHTVYLHQPGPTPPATATRRGGPPQRAHRSRACRSRRACCPRGGGAIPPLNREILPAREAISSLRGIPSHRRKHTSW